MNTEPLLARFIDTSAPCSHCVYLKITRNSIACTFPLNRKKECSIEPGIIHGFRTSEYV